MFWNTWLTQLYFIWTSRHAEFHYKTILQSGKLNLKTELLNYITINWEQALLKTILFKVSFGKHFSSYCNTLLPIIDEECFFKRYLPFYRPPSFMSKFSQIQKFPNYTHGFRNTYETRRKFGSFSDFKYPYPWAVSNCCNKSGLSCSMSKYTGISMPWPAIEPP